MVLFRTAILVASLAMQVWTTASTSAPRPFNQATDVKLGFLDHMDGSLEISGTSSSSREVVNERHIETFDLKAYTPNNVTSLMARKSRGCYSRAGWDYVVCETMPDSYVRYGMGAALLIYYTPRILFNYLTFIGRLVHGSDYVWRTRRSNELGA